MKTRALIGVVVAAAGLCVIALGVYGLLGGQAQAAVGVVRVSPPIAVAATTAKPEAPSLPAPAAPPAPKPVQAAPTPIVRSMLAANSPGDLDCLAAAVYYEARGEPMAGQAAVAQVVLNRARAPHFPKNVCGVVYQGVAGHGCQFSFVCNGAMRRPREQAAWARAKDVAVRALDGYVMAAIGQATSFHAVRLGGGAGPVVRVGGHVFYNGTGRTSSSALDRPILLARNAPADPARPRYTFALGVLTPVPASPRPANSAPPIPPASTTPASSSTATTTLAAS
ncbi:MAG: cell wall hydrolase [Caulobacteraceae bacterium]